MSHVVALERVEHLVRVAASVGGRPGRFLVDSGIGLTVVSTSTAEAAGAEPLDRAFAGQRMSGQAVELPLVRLPEIRVGSWVVPGHVAGVIDLGAADGDSGFDGILGLDLFAERCLTVDPGAQTLTVDDRAPAGLVVPVEVVRDGIAISLHTSLELPSGRVVTVEVDTGSGCLILDDSLMAECGVRPDDPGLEVRTGTDETGHHYTRRFVTVEGAVCAPGLPVTRQERPRVMFQKIQYDGLLGAAFLDRFRHTFDVRGAKIVLEPLP